MIALTHFIGIFLQIQGGGGQFLAHSDYSAKNRVLCSFHFVIINFRIRVNGVFDLFDLLLISYFTRCLTKEHLWVSNLKSCSYKCQKYSIYPYVPL